MIRYEPNRPMTQSELRRHIAALESMQDRRIVLAEQKKQQMDNIIERERQRIENLKQQLTIGVAR